MPFISLYNKRDTRLTDSNFSSKSLCTFVGTLCYFYEIVTVVFSAVNVRGLPLLRSSAHPVPQNLQ